MERPRVHVSLVLEDVGGVLVVQEAKPDVRGRWNLPGGHVEKGEAITAAGIREVREETGLHAEVTSLVCVVVSPGAIRFVLGGEVVGGVEQPGDDILAVRRLRLEALEALPDHQLDSAGVLRVVFERLRAGERHPLRVLAEGLV